MRQMIRDGQITGAEVDIWLSSLAFIKNPTREMMKELKVAHHKLFQIPPVAETQPELRFCCLVLSDLWI